MSGDVKHVSRAPKLSAVGAGIAFHGHLWPPFYSWHDAGKQQQVLAIT